VAAARLPDDPAERDLPGRRDLRALPFVTIDGETARDFDDAVCLEDEGGGSRLWVAIADVSHYVRPRSVLDAEAALRGTSVYFPDRAVPMLPPQLSTMLCSLNPRRPRLVLVAELTYDARGRRTSAIFYRGVIESRARLTYTQVAGVVSGADTAEIRAWRAELGPLVPQLERMRALMRVLYHNRVEAGSLDLDLPEALVDLSEEGRSVGVRLLERNDAHRLIEEFMLEANRAVAIFLGARGVPLPYRIHEPPDPADVDDLNEFIGAFGMRLAYEGRVEPADVQRLLRRLDGHPLARVLSRQVLRALTKAQYSTTNAGHFGLAFSDYCHFTSPIRRYPDLLVHRQLGRVFDGELDAARAGADALEKASIESSRAERAAMEAERAMLDLKKGEFMRGHLREPGPATIVSVLKFGFFVELDAYPVEGLVRIETLADDQYRFVETQRALVGLRKRQRYRLGDRVLVEATDVSLERRQIDFRLLERITARTSAAPAPSGTPRPATRRAARNKRPSRR
jgi:ribonuclease R